MGDCAIVDVDANVGTKSEDSKQTNLVTDCLTNERSGFQWEKAERGREGKPAREKSPDEPKPETPTGTETAAGAPMTP